MNLLQTNQLLVGYDRCQLHEKPINYQLSRGQLVCLLGPNGVGKSTLLRTLAGFQKPVGGAVYWSGAQPSKMKPFEKAAHTAFVSPHPASPEHMRAIDAIKLGRHHFTGWLDQLNIQDQTIINQCVEQLNIEHLINRTLNSLSDGERQRIEIARSLCQQASLLILDEPTAFLDLPHKVQLMQTLQNLCHQSNISVLMSSHDLDLSLGWADQIILFSGLKTILFGSPEEMVLSGNIMQFSSEAAETWDMSLGYLRILRNRQKLIILEGPESLHKTWTQRGLERLGFTISDDIHGDVAVIRVAPDQNSKYIEWTLQEGPKTSTFTSIDQAMQYLSALI